MNIYVTAPFDEKLIHELSTSHHVIFEPWSEDKALLREEELHAKLLENNTEILVCESDVITEKVLAGLKNLRMICVCRAGLNNVDLASATEHGILITNTPGRNANAVAEITVALFINLCRYMSIGEHLLRSGNWDESLYFKLRGIELFGHTVGFIGFGAVPRELSKKLCAFGMNMIAYDPYVKDETANKYGVKMVDIETLLKESDFISNHLPVTEVTKGFIDASKINLMKKSAYFINTARAATVDEDALIKALQTKSINGAAFDVYNEEPLPKTHPLLSLDNVILLPHLGGSSLNVVTNHSRMVVEDIDMFVNGLLPRRLVNREISVNKP